MDLRSQDDSRKYQASIIPLWDSFYSSQVSPLILAAKRKIYLTSYKLEPKDSPRSRRVMDLINLLVESAARGVDVRILLNFQDNKGATSGINWWAARVLAKRNVYARYVPGCRILHAKIMTIDDRYSVIGSHNFSVMSHDKNIEYSTLVDSGHYTLDLVSDLDYFWYKAVLFPGCNNTARGKF